MPSIFCKTHGPRFVLVVVPALIVCHGQANLTCGRCTLTPMRWNAADSAVMTTAAIARRKISPMTRTTTLQLTRRGIRRRRGGGSRQGTTGPGGPAPDPASVWGGVPAGAGRSGPYPGGYGAVSVP